MDKKQSDQFKAAARALECELSEKRFNASLGTIARQKPSDPPAPKAKPARKSGKGH